MTSVQSTTKKTYLAPRYARVFLRGLVGWLLLLLYTKKKFTQTPRVIVVIQGAQLGDMICTTPVFHAIKVKFPEVKLIVVGNGINKCILEGNSNIDEYLVYDQSDPVALSSELRKKNIDVGIIPGPGLDSLLTLALARVPFIIVPTLTNGWSPSNTNLYRLLSKMVVTRPHVMGNYAPREYLRLLEPLDIHTDDITKHLSFTQEGLASVNTYLLQHNIAEDESFVCITPGAGNKVKEWPAERFAKIAEHVWNTYHLPIVVIGTHVDREEITHMMLSLKVPIEQGMKCVNAMDAFKLDELKALIAKARLLIGVDTGPIYIAEAFNTPLIDIVGPVSEKEQPPFGKDRIIVLPPHERVPQMHIMNARIFDEEEARRQILSTTVEQVVQAVDTLLV